LILAFILSFFVFLLIQVPLKTFFISPFLKKIPLY
jgi:hypothetical protein